jgi:hypothetical protein
LEDQFLDIIKRKGTAGERAKFFRDLEQRPEDRKAFMAFEKLWVLNKMAHKKSTLPYRRKGFDKIWEQVKPGIRLRNWSDFLRYCCGSIDCDFGDSCCFQFIQQTCSRDHVPELSQGKYFTDDTGRWKYHLA